MEQEFKEHELYLAADNVFTLKKPGTNHARMDFILNDNFLIVTGDYGCAVFWLTEKASIPSLANYNLGYLMSKLQCSDRQKKHYKEIWEYLLMLLLWDP
jgi:hypothetical protein